MPPARPVPPIERLSPADGRAAMLRVDGVHFAHPGGRAQLTDVHMQAHSGEVVCLLGPNGAGKTTLLRIVLGLLPHTRGSIAFAGRRLDALGARERARLAAYVPQTAASAFPFTTLDMAVMGRTPHIGAMRTPSVADRRAARDVLAGLGIDHLADQAFASLSGGEKALTLVARAVVQEASMLILDEPTAALDLGNATRVMGVLRGLARDGRTVVMTTHQPDHALREADRAVLLFDGRVVAEGHPSAVLTAERLTEVYATPIVVGDLPLPGGSVPVCIPMPAHDPCQTARPAHAVPPAGAVPTASHDFAPSDDLRRMTHDEP